MKLLEFFVSQPQHMLITQEQLREHLYGRSPVNLEAVPVAVKSLRNALGPGFITTDHGKGYRLVAEIRHFERDEQSSLSPPPPEQLPGEDRRLADREVDEAERLQTRSVSSTPTAMEGVSEPPEKAAGSVGALSPSRRVFYGSPLIWAICACLLLIVG